MIMYVRSQWLYSETYTIKDIISITLSHDCSNEKDSDRDKIACARIGRNVIWIDMAPYFYVIVKNVTYMFY